jgi:hypothetical protein
MDRRARLGHRRRGEALRFDCCRRRLERGTTGVALPHAIWCTIPGYSGQFFAPTSGATLVGAIGALICGWRTPASYRAWLWSSAILILGLWVFTMVAFWPSNHAVFAAASAPPLSPEAHAELIRRAHQWITFDWCRVAVMMGGFISSATVVIVDRLLAVEQENELALRLTADRLLALLRVGLEASCGRAAEPRGHLGLSKRPYQPVTNEKPVDAVDTRRLRRLYKTRWERAKRRRLREWSEERVVLMVRRSLAKKLHAATPKGVGFNNFLLRLLSIGVGGKPLSKSVEVFRRRALGGEPDYLRKKDACPGVIAGAKVGRNERCTCESGRKWKHCCGAVGNGIGKEVLK